MAGKDFELEDIHQFRVSFKKLRTFLRLMSQHTIKTGEIKVTKKLKTCYRIFGAIRDLQLQQQRITATKKQQTEVPETYLRLVQKEIGKLKLKLNGISMEKQVAQSKRKTDASLPDQFPSTALWNFADKKWEKIYGIIVSGNYSDQNIHTIRKELKDLFYVAKMYEGVKNKLLPGNILIGNNEHYCSLLLDKLGYFQDLCIAISLLKSNQFYNLNDLERVLMEKIKKEWLKEKRAVKRLLVNHLKNDIALQHTALKVTRNTISC